MITFPKEIEKYRDQWVALTPDNRLAGHGKTPELTLADAAAQGEKNPVLFYAAKEFWMPNRALAGGRFVEILNA